MSRIEVTRKLSDDFASVAERLECDEDLEAFDAKLKKIAKAEPKKRAGEVTDRVIRGWSCYLCHENIPETEVDPCSVVVTTRQGRWQEWFCHAACFKACMKDPIRSHVEYL